MVSRLPSWVFIALAMVFMGLALVPVLRVIIGVGSAFGIQFFTFVMFLIAGLMCGLTGMLLLVRRQPDQIGYQGEGENSQEKQIEKQIIVKMHATGLLLFTGVPLFNFLVCYFLWVRNRHKTQLIDYQGREAICFQISVYLYLLLCLFMTIALIGVFITPLFLLFHLIATIVASVMAYQGRPFRYPANITIISRAPNSGANLS